MEVQGAGPDRYDPNSARPDHRSVLAAIHMKRFVALVATACLLAAAAVSAHDEVVEETVQIALRVAEGRLAAQMRVPVSVLADGALPRLPDGTLDTAAISEPLRIVSADAVRNLDLQQDGTSLPQASFATRLSADRSSIEIDAAYPLAGTTGISARLNTFQSKPLRPVRTRVEYTPPTGTLQVVSVVGQAHRVSFDPDAGATVGEFIRQSLQTVLGFGDHLLLLVCLLLPMRSARSAVRLIGLLLIAETVGVVTYVAAPDALAGLAPAAALVAASLVVIAALQVVVGARTSLVAAVALALGFVFGIGYGNGLVDSLQLAGSHHALATLSAVVTMLVAQAWLGAIIWAARSWLDGRGVPAYPLGLFFAILIGHTAVHRVAAASDAVGEKGSFLADHAILLLALAWAVAMLVVAAIEMRRRPVSSQGSMRLSKQSPS